MYGIKLLTRLRAEFSDLRGHRYNHNFHCSEPSCFCQTGVEDNKHFLLHCPLLNLVANLVGTDIICLSSKELPRELRTLLLSGNNDFSFLVSRGVMEETIKYIKNTKRFK